VALSLYSGDAALATWRREEIPDTVYYKLPCSQNTTIVRVSYTTPAGVSGWLAQEEDEGEENGTEKEAAYWQVSDSLIAVDVSKPGHKVFTIILSSGKRYTVVVEKPYRLFDAVIEHLGNVRVVNNNPNLNGGYSFTSCEWWKKVDGEWQVVEINDFYYSAGPNATDKFSPDDSMYVVLYTAENLKISTCPDVTPRGAAEADNNNGDDGNGGNNSNTSRRSDENVDNSAYPNPVSGGSKIYLKESVIIGSGGEARYATYRLFTSQGKLVLSGSAFVLIEGLVMPEQAGTYYLILDGKAGRKAMQIAVGN
jgi:hypothetical protein